MSRTGWTTTPASSPTSAPPWRSRLNWQRGIFAFAEVTDLGDKIGSQPIPGTEPYHEFKDHLVTPGGFLVASGGGW
jgi:hypothetical protein